jgi:DNA-binding NarL/FixJ family response regulator
VRILIVDGSARVRARLAERLKPHATLIGEAAELNDALIAAEIACPDAVIVDVHVDVDMGIAGLRRLRRAVPDATIVVLTNEATEFHRGECVRAGADFFFDKSVDFDRAVEVVAARSVRRRPMTPSP